MSPALSKPGCPLCLKNGRLKGGELFSSGLHWYIYVFRNDDGSIKGAMLNPQVHYVDLSMMPPGAGEEYLAFRGFVHRELFPLRDFNTSSNEGGEGSQSQGYFAGVRVKEHLHEHLIPRTDGLPSSGMGTGLLIGKFDGLVNEIREMIQDLDPVHAARLLDIVTRATDLATP